MQTTSHFRLRSLAFICMGLGALLLAGCQGQMTHQPKYRPYAPSSLFADGKSARAVPDGVVAADAIIDNDPFITGKGADGQPLATIPILLTLEVVQRGQQRYDIYCSPCHGYDGYGKGMIVQRGFSPPPTFHSDRLRTAPAGHFFDVMTNGFGQMYSYAYRIEPADRWAIVAYIRALQLSQNASRQDVPPDQQQNLK